VLEYRAIVERLARATGTPHGEALALAHEPSPEPAEVRRRQGLTAEAIALYENATEPSLDGIDDIRDAVAHAAREAVLTPAALHGISVSVRVAVAARAALESQLEIAPTPR
jgi:dsDNA-specific endonuclease/ATPase MutS2